MNWFERYSIPGGYFIIHTLFWLYLINSKILLLFCCNFPQEIIIALIGVSILPIGYIITIFQQVLYFIIPFMGLIRAAKKCLDPKRQGKYGSISEIIKKTVHEPELEAHYSFHLVFGLDPTKLDKLKYFQEWSRKRMNVMAMSLSIIIATIISIVLVFLANYISRMNHPINVDLKRLSLCIALSFSICLIMFGIWWQLRKSIKSALGDILKDKMFGNNKIAQI
jgi:hypothetical protein